MEELAVTISQKKMLAMDKPGKGVMKEPMCGHCYEKYARMTEPRKMPCSHIFCMPCIRLDVQRTHSLRCPTCKTDHSDVNIDSLPKIVRVVTPTITHMEKLTESSEEDELNLSPMALLCDICHKDQSDADSFCIDCGKKMCEKHLEFHDEYQTTFSRKSHNVIAIESYKSFPAKYEIRKCSDHHEKPLRRACENCHRMFCDRCDTKKKCPAVRGKPHEIKLLEDVGGKFKNKLMAHMKMLSDKLADACKLEQKTCGELTHIKETVCHMTDEVDKVTSEQIAVIRHKADMLKAEIRDYELESVKQVERYITELVDKKQLVDDLWKSTQKLLTHSHEADVVKAYKYKSVEIEQALKIEFGFCQLPFKRMLIRTGDFKDIELQLRDSAPSTMKFRSRENKPTSLCSTVCWTEGGNIVCGRDATLEVRQSRTMDATSSLKTSSANGVALHKQGTLALFWKDGKDYIILYSPELEFLKLFGEFFRSTDKFSHLASSDLLVAAVDPDQRQLKVFSTAGQFLYDMKLLGMMRPWGVHFLRDGCVLVTDFIAGCLKKYYVKSGSSEPVWVCRDLLSPVGISTNTHGLIFVASFTAKKIYVISQQGVLLKELTNQKLLHIKEIYDITVTEDQIALACGNDGVVCFQMMFDALVMG